MIAEIDNAALDAVSGGDAAAIVFVAPPAVMIAALETVRQILDSQSGYAPDGN